MDDKFLLPLIILGCVTPSSHQEYDKLHSYVTENQLFLSILHQFGTVCTCSGNKFFNYHRVMSFQFRFTYKGYEISIIVTASLKVLTECFHLVFYVQ